jgi:hypothetical protein
MKNLYFESDNDFHNAIYPFKKIAEKWKKVDSFADIFRSSDKIDCIDDAKSTGSSKGDARKDCKKELGGNIFVRGAKVQALRAPRSSFLGLLSLNYRGMASRISRAKLNEPEKYKEVVSKFQKLGGDKSTFEKSLSNGKDKKPLVCGSKCKDKINFSGGYYNSFSGTEIAGAIAIATPIIVPIIAIVDKMVATNSEKRAQAEEDENTKEIMDKQLAQAEEENRAEEERMKADSGLINNVIIGSSILVGVLITGVVVMKLIKKKKR